MRGAERNEVAFDLRAQIVSGGGDRGEAALLRPHDIAPYVRPASAQSIVGGGRREEPGIAEQQIPQRQPDLLRFDGVEPDHGHGGLKILVGDGDQRSIADGVGLARQRRGASRCPERKRRKWQNLVHCNLPGPVCRRDWPMVCGTKREGMPVLRLSVCLSAEGRQRKTDRKKEFGAERRALHPVHSLVSRVKCGRACARLTPIEGGLGPRCVPDTVRWLAQGLAGEGSGSGELVTAGDPWLTLWVKCGRVDSRLSELSARWGAACPRVVLD